MNKSTKRGSANSFLTHTIREKGITLIALVITIIILLILAGVTLNIVFNGGLMEKSQEAVDTYSLEQAREEVRLATVDYKMDQYTKGKAANLETNLSEVGVVSQASDTNYLEVTVDKYVFWVHKDTLEIILKGENQTPVIPEGPVTPEPPQDIALTGIAFSEEETVVGINRTKTLEIEYTPENATNKEIEWSSSNAEVATVNENGIVSGIKSGEVTITAKSKENAELTAQITVNVQEILEISTVEELKAFRDDVNGGNTYEGKTVLLMNDLDLNPGKYTVGTDGTITFNEDAEQWTAIGTETYPFSGSFNGQGNTISGLYINKPTEQYQGLFGYISGEKIIIENLGLKSASVDGFRYIGGFAGKIINTTMRNCYATGKISGAGKIYYSDVYTGGLIGYIDSSKIENCYNTSTVGPSDLSNIHLNSYGGIVSSSINSTIKNCYNYGKVSGRQYVGRNLHKCNWFYLN